MTLPKLAVRRPITTTMALVSVLVVAGLALARLPLAYLPELDVPFIGIEIPYPSSNPLQVEREITKPVEEVLSTLPGITKLSSESTADGAEMRLEFQWGEELDLVRMQVSEKIDQIKPSLPVGIGDVRIYSFSTSDIPVVQGRISAQGVDLSRNFDLLETRVLNPLRRLPGVARVDLNGVAPKEISIDLVLDRIKEHRIDLDPLVERLAGAGTNLVVGRVDSGGLRYTARSLGSFQSLDELAEMVIDQRGLTLGDIAEINYEEPPIAFGRHLDGKYAIALDVYKESTANTVDVVHAVRRVLEEDIDRDPLLAGIQLLIFEDQAEGIENGINGLTQAGLIGALLAVLSLYFFLRRLDSTLIVSLSIPFSLVATCGVLWFLGKSLNILSMMGLMLAVGMLVDNAIVVLEAIDRRLRDEPSREKAALEGSQQVTMAVTASTLTSLIVFLPLVVGAKTDLATWLKEVGITISLALACSLLSSLTLIPLVSAHFLKTRDVKPGRFLPWLEERYSRTLGWTLHHRAKTAGLLVLGLVVGFLPFPLGWVKTGIFSAVLNERLALDYEFHDFAYKSDAERAVNQVEALLFSHQKELGVDSVYSYYTENEAGTRISFGKHLGDDEMKAKRAELRPLLPVIPGVELTFDEDSEEGGSTTFFRVKLFGQDSALLYRLADEAGRRLETVTGVQDVKSPRAGGRREIEVAVDRDKAATLGFTPRDVSQIFAFTLGGMRLPRFNAGEREVDTWLALRLEDRADLADLEQIQISQRDGRPVLLGDIADFRVVERPRSIAREDRKVQVAVRATYEGEDWDGTRQEIEGLMNSLAMPGGYSWSFNERIVEQQGQNQEMAVNLLLALALVYLVMASLFESLALPFAILFAIVFAVPGAAWFLALTGTPFNLMAQIGLLILMGIVVNNGIVLLDHMSHLRAAGMSTEEAILAAGRDRLRPILMTAATTIIGLLPLAVGSANVSGLLYFPMARTVMGGLISSVVFTLLVLPFLALAVEGIASWLSRLWRVSAPMAVETPEATVGG